MARRDESTEDAARRSSAQGMDVVLALDLGSTWLKGGLVDLDGKLLHLERVASPLQGEGPLDAEDIWQATVGLLRRLCRQAGPAAAPLAVSITGATRSHVFLDAQQRPFGPVMLWNDPAGSELGERVSRAYGFTGDTPGFGAYHPLARILRVGQDRGAMPHRLVELKDWLNYRLTGRLATDAVAYGRIEPDASSGLSVDDILARLALPRTVIPPCAPPASILGRTGDGGRADASDKAGGVSLGLPSGIPVVVGSFDTWASCLGMGAMRDGGVYDISGTTQVLGAFSRAPRPVPRMVSMRWTDDLWQTGGPCQTGMGTLAWFARAFLDSDDPAQTLAVARASRARDVPLCLPYLAGERMPLWSSALSASFHGVKSHHLRADLAQALVEGLVLAHRLALDALQVRNASTTLHMGGGGTRLPEWVQARADAFGMTVELGQAEEPALVGAALAAATALGSRPSLEAAQNVLKARSVCVTPRMSRTAYYDSRAKEFSMLLSRDPSLS